MVSAATARTRPSAAANCRSAACNFCCERPTSTTCAPRSTADAATPRPIPELPPTITTFLSTSVAMWPPYWLSGARAGSSAPKGALDVGDDDLLHLVHGLKDTFGLCLVRICHPPQ